MNKIKIPTFEQLPIAVVMLQNSIEDLKSLILQRENPSSQDEVFDISQASEFIKFSKPTLYGYCQRNEIPYSKKGGKTFFFKSELIQWLKEGKQKTLKELSADADAYLISKR
jgi:predicted DNA-binding transcriptional regulator AlpA